MNPQELIELKHQVIEAFRAHELGETLTLSDKLYDEKLKKIKEEDPTFNIYDFQPNEADENGYIPHRSGMEDLEKEYTHNIPELWCFEVGHHKLPKWDGSSIVIYYTLGKLDKILSMSDKEVGVDQTEKFKSFVPHSVDKSVSFIRCECLIDARIDDNARGKANGLVNSRYLQEEVDDKATLVAFCAHGLSGEMLSYDDFCKFVPKWGYVRVNGIPKFMRSPEVQELQLDHGVVSYCDGKVNVKFSVDGIVYYGEGFAYKYDYINSALTKVTSINWYETEKEGFFPTVSVEEVELDGAAVRNPSSNGVPNMIRMGIGVGATVEVIRSGLTIPKIINVVTPAEVEFPKCPHCGYQMSEEDLYGSTLKCGNPDCIGKYESRKTSLEGWIEGLEDKIEEARGYTRENAEEMFFWLLNISRFDENKKRYSDEVKEDFYKHLIEDSYENFCEWLGNSYSWSDLQWSEFELNIKSTYKVIKEYLI
jgi:NAD-dependent DNA ligase